jgi:hypothetical protein
MGEHEREGHGFTACGKNSGFDFALKGHGFSRAVSIIFIAALAAEGRQFSN